MIVSHRHKFVFIHLSRTGGRSLSLELAEHCGPNDIITPTGDDAGRNHQGWVRHTSARKVRERLGQQLLDDYFVFTVERNPWDRVLSNYWAYAGYQHGTGGRTEQINWCDRLWRKLSGYPWSFDRWLRYRVWRAKVPGFGRRVFPKACSNYTDERGNLMVDAVFRYEHLSDQIELLSAALGLPLTWRASEGRATRKDQRDYTDVYSQWGESVITDFYADTIKLMNYRFGHDVPADVVGFQPGDEKRRAA